MTSNEVLPYMEVYFYFIFKVHLTEVSELFIRCSVCDALRDLVPFVQLKDVKNTYGGMLLLVKLQYEAQSIAYFGLT